MAHPDELPHMFASGLAGGVVCCGWTGSGSGSSSSPVCWTVPLQSGCSWNCRVKSVPSMCRIAASETRDEFSIATPGDKRGNATPMAVAVRVFRREMISPSEQWIPLEKWTPALGHTLQSDIEAEFRVGAAEGENLRFEILVCDGKRVCGHSAKEAREGMVEGASFSFCRPDGKSSLDSIKLPVSEFGLSLLVNSDSGTGRNGCLSRSGGIGDGRQSALSPLLKLRRKSRFS